MRIKVDHLAGEVLKTLAEYQDTSINTLKAAVDNTAKDLVKELKQTSPRRSGAYARGWYSKVTTKGNKWAYEKTVYNKDHYRLTHLLEKGHRVVNARNGRTFVHARPHIAKAEQEAVDSLVKNLKENL